MAAVDKLTKDHCRLSVIATGKDGRRLVEIGTRDMREGDTLTVVGVEEGLTIKIKVETT